MGTTPPRRQRRDDDNIDEFMASLIRSDDFIPSDSQKKTLFSKKPRSPQDALPAKKQPEASVISRNNEPSSTTAPPLPTKGRFIKPMLALACMAIAITSAILLWQGPISSLVEPKSPFAQEIQERMGDTPLYFPTQLPAGFKIDLDSISQPETTVVIYVISDDANKRVNVTLQKQPADINLEPLHAILANTRDIQTRFGTVKTGLSEEGIQITNILAGRTWILITSTPDTVSDQDLAGLIDSLREG